VYFREAGRSTVHVRAYVLTQSDLLNELEVLELPEFAVFEIPINELQDCTGLDVRNARSPRRSTSQTEALDSKRIARKVASVNDII